MSIKAFIFSGEVETCHSITQNRVILFSKNFEIINTEIIHILIFQKKLENRKIKNVNNFSVNIFVFLIPRSRYFEVMSLHSRELFVTKFL